jgi:signal transduction histidine kinase
MQDLPTKFASAQRSSSEEVQIAQQVIGDEKFLVTALNAYPDIVLVLNENRQIIYANEKLVAILGLTGVEDVLGKRPGEAFSCIHSDKEQAGCGTSEFCRECGAVRSILNSQKGKADFQECRITVHSPQGDVSLDLRVWAVPIEIQHRKFTFFTIKDIENEKRREALEHTFFHDILNEAGILAGFSENLRDGFAPKDINPGERMYGYSQRIIESIQEQRDLLNAEQGFCSVNWEDFPVAPFLNEVAGFYVHHRAAAGRRLELEPVGNESFVKSDKVLLRRVLGNLLKNALEATTVGDCIKFGFKEADGKKIFWVHNPGVMPQAAQLQVFQRSFSTKGKGRGIGTYSVKLFVEQYLKGKVSFESAEGKGTTFFVEFR